MGNATVRTIIRAVCAGILMGGVLLAATLGPASAQAGPEVQDPGAFEDENGDGSNIDEYLAGSTGSEDGCSPASAQVGDTVTCTVKGYAEGETVTATLTCGPVVVFQGPSTGTTFTFSFVVPDVPAGECALEVCGTDTGGEAFCRNVAFEVVSVTTAAGAALARTGSNNTGTLVGVGAALVVLGSAAVFGARRRFATVKA